MGRRAKIVWTPFGTKQKIAAALGVSVQSISYALNGKIDNTLADKIKYVAIKEYGGSVVEYYDDFVPDCDSEIDDDTHDMEATYSDRVKVVYNANQKIAGVYIDGELKSTHIVKTIADYMDLQKSVQDVVNDLCR